MSSLPPALNFADSEVEICKKWNEEDSFRQQNKLADERGDDVSRYFIVYAQLFYPIFLTFMWGEEIGRRNKFICRKKSSASMNSTDQLIFKKMKTIISP